MTNVIRDGMFEAYCSYCGKPMKVFAKNKRGDLPTVYCSSKCEGDANYEKKFINRQRA
jgi:hypothetical protein